MTIRSILPRSSSRLRDQRGMTLIELCIVIVILSILLLIGVASLLRARVSANEASAIGALKTINSAQIAYASACGGGNFAASLPVLGHKPPGNSQGFVSEDLGHATAPELSGYRINVRPGNNAVPMPTDCNGAATLTNYYAIAIPMAVGQTGTRSFATSQRAGIYQMPGGTPPSEPFGPPSAIVQ
jgi:prepilin-type N-terminal cleavage/methylation domain-containing protein